MKDLAGEYAHLSLDGFFLDNADVYYHHETEEVFEGLCAILRGLETYHLPLIINGGDVFVSRCMEEGIVLDLFAGINQETVFTSIDFDKNTYQAQEASETAYYLDYLEQVK